MSPWTATFALTRRAERPDAPRPPIIGRLSRRLVAEELCAPEDVAQAWRLAESPAPPPIPLRSTSGPFPRALSARAQWVEALGAALLSLGHLDDAAWARALAAEAGLPRANLEDGAAPPDPNTLPARAFLRAVPAAVLDLTNASATVAVANPFDAFPESALRLALGRRIRRVVATPAEIHAALDRLKEAAPDPARPTGDDDLDALRARAAEGPVVRYVDGLIARAIETGASDIHLEPDPTAAASRSDAPGRVTARLRVDGLLHAVDPPPAELAAAIVSRLKIMAGLDIAERRRPQDGRADLDGGAGRDLRRGDRIDLRIATAPALRGETVTLRLLRRGDAPPTLDALGVDSTTRAVFERALARVDGLTLVTGPTGAGKTTTLYALMQRLRGPARKILSIEDPVEYQISGIAQLQTRDALGLDFAACLRAALRHDPDVLMVGETRDGETARAAVQAALTGHAVFTSLHTEDAASAVIRLHDLGVAPYLLAATVKTVVAQRLTRRLCGACRRPETLDPQRAAALGLEPGATTWTAPGCAACRGGVDGRVGVFETLEITPELATLIAESAPVAAVRAAARTAGGSTLAEAGRRLALNGEISATELARVLGRGALEEL